VLVERGDRVAIEEPHYNGIREVLRLPVPVCCRSRSIATA
jgi:DNA-binding transcriptional MocR family regulator